MLRVRAPCLAFFLLFMVFLVHMLSCFPLSDPALFPLFLHTCLPIPSPFLEAGWLPVAWTSFQALQRAVEWALGGVVLYAFTFLAFDTLYLKNENKIEKVQWTLNAMQKSKIGRDVRDGKPKYRRRSAP